jgi:hypothetical protein
MKFKCKTCHMKSEKCKTSHDKNEKKKWFWDSLKSILMFQMGYPNHAWT